MNFLFNTKSKQNNILIYKDQFKYLKKNKSSFFSALSSNNPLNFENIKHFEEFSDLFVFYTTYYGAFYFYPDKDGENWTFEFVINVKDLLRFNLTIFQNGLKSGDISIIYEPGSQMFRYRITSKSVLITKIVPIFVENPLLTKSAKLQFNNFNEALLVDSDEDLSRFEKNKKLIIIRKNSKL